MDEPRSDLADGDVDVEASGIRPRSDAAVAIADQPATPDTADALRVIAAELAEANSRATQQDIRDRAPGLWRGIDHVEWKVRTRAKEGEAPVVFLTVRHHLAKPLHRLAVKGEIRSLTVEMDDRSSVTSGNDESADAHERIEDARPGKARRSFVSVLGDRLRHAFLGASKPAPQPTAKDSTPEMTRPERRVIKLEEGDFREVALRMDGNMLPGHRYRSEAQPIGDWPGVVGENERIVGVDCHVSHFEYTAGDLSAEPDGLDGERSEVVVDGLGNGQEGTINGIPIGTRGDAEFSAIQSRNVTNNFVSAF